MLDIRFLARVSGTLQSCGRLRRITPASLQTYMSLNRTASAPSVRGGSSLKAHRCPYGTDSLESALGGRSLRDLVRFRSGRAGLRSHSLLKSITV